jgi:hypothetical protein
MPGPRTQLRLCLALPECWPQLLTWFRSGQALLKGQ